MIAQVVIFSEEWMLRWLIDVLKRETILVIAVVLAVISCFIVRPDAQYASYIHVNTIAQLVCLMTVVGGLQRLGVFRIIGVKLLTHVRSLRGLFAILVFLPFFFGMLVTNDVALVTFVPFAIAVLMIAREENYVCLAGTLMTIAANTGAMLTPVGNAHNLYLGDLSHYSVTQFLQIMGPYTAISAVGLLAVIFFAVPKKKVRAFEKMDENSLQRGVAAPSNETEKPDKFKAMDFSASKTFIYCILFLVCVCAVSGFMHVYVMTALVFVAVIICDRRVFIGLDWCLPLNFCAFFIFIGNMARVPEFANIASHFVGKYPLQLGVVSSQIISNVPTTLLLSGFSDNWRPLIIGTNLGGLGTLIASMASLVTYKIVVGHYANQKKRYLTVYSLINIFFLVLTVGLSYIIE